MAEAAPAPHVIEEPAPAPAVARTEEARYATTPAPSDIRARAEEVRQRALAAREARDNARRAAEMPHHDEEPALFDLDDASLDRGAAAPVEQAAQDDSQPGRGGLFTINKLIHRVAGNGVQENPAARAERREPTTPDIDEDGGDIPAFLRRQAN